MSRMVAAFLLAVNINTHQEDFGFSPAHQPTIRTD
jgi:hypothetical protein